MNVATLIKPRAEVRRRRVAGASVRELMAEFGMSEPYVRNLISGQRRAEVES